MMRFKSTAFVVNNDLRQSCGFGCWFRFGFEFGVGHGVDHDIKQNDRPTD